VHCGALDHSRLGHVLGLPRSAKTASEARRSNFSRPMVLPSSSFQTSVEDEPGSPVCLTCLRRPATTHKWVAARPFERKAPAQEAVGQADCAGRPQRMQYLELAARVSAVRLLADVRNFTGRRSSITLSAFLEIVHIAERTLFRSAAPLVHFFSAFKAKPLRPALSKRCRSAPRCQSEAASPPADCRRVRAARVNPRAGRISLRDRPR
jgi:hypothetical protein